MSQDEALNKDNSVFAELSETIDKLKNKAKEDFNQKRNGFEDDYEIAYLRGYLFGQLATFEDCYNLFATMLRKLSNNQSDKDIIIMLKQQLIVSLNIINTIYQKNTDKEPIEEYLKLTENAVFLIKEASGNV